MSLQQTDVDGVPTLVAATPGPTVAGLVFRVGRADETLARSGLTHLLEHLALYPLGLTDYHYNGSTGPVATSFHTTGSSEDVSTFLTRVCDSLAALPMARLQAEKSIVRTEWSSRTNSVYTDLPLWRYGARNYGLVSYSEPGVSMIEAEELDHWRRTWFTRENAVLWIAGQIPAGLRLRLPSGQRHSVPVPTSALPSTPAFFSSDRNVVAMDAVVRRRPAVSVFAQVLERSLYRDLRQEGSYSYAAAAATEPRGDGWTTLTAGADALPESLDATLGGFIDVLARLRAGRIDGDDIAAYLAKLHDRALHPDAEAGLLADSAFDLLTGTPVRDLERRIADLESVTTADVHAVAGETWDAALLMVPAGRTADWAGFTAAPTHSAGTVTGPKIASRQSDRLSLYIASDGVMHTLDDESATVKFDQVAAMMSWADGARRLVGDDAISVHIEPTMWELPPQMIAQIDASVPPDRVINFPARSPDNIPQPKAPEAKPGNTGRGVWSGWELTGLIISLIASVLMLCLSGLLALVASEDTGSPDDIGWGASIVTAVCMGVFLLPAIAIVIRRRRRRR
jgi:zinc protease